MSHRRGLTGLVCGALALGGCLDTFVFDRDGQVSDGAMDGAPRGDGPVDGSCPVGEHLCTGTCVDSHSVATCGTGCTPCAPAPANGTLTCDGTTCGFTCGVGYVPSSGICAPVGPPRPTAPLSTSTTTSALPMFHWALAAGSDGAHVQVYRDRACTQVVTEFNAAGSSGAPSVALSGVVFWRLQSRSMGTTLAGNSPVWQVNIGQSAGTVNTSSGTTLDVNGDGYADVAVGAGYANMQQGQVSLYLGNPSGIPSAASTTLAPPNGGFFGSSVASAGDVNGDGYADLIVGASGASASAGEAYLFLGGGGGFPPTPSQTLHSPAAGADFGGSVSAAGDVNGDGYGDVVVGAFAYMGNAGAAYVYFGGTGGLPMTPSITLTSPSGGAFGVVVADAGDVNGDGFADLVIGARLASAGSGRAYLFTGGPSGTATTPATTLTGHAANDNFGVSVGSAGDINGDGYFDVIVGASGAESVYVFTGGATGIGTTSAYTLSEPASGFGFSSSGVGDVNGDGRSDILVGAYGVNSNAGEAYLFVGSTGGGFTTPSAPLLTGSMGDYLGDAVAGAGDVNQDGLDDILIGASAILSTNHGHVYFFEGHSPSLATSPTTTLVGASGDAFGRPVARATPLLHRRSPLMCTRTRTAPQS